MVIHEAGGRRKSAGPKSLTGVSKMNKACLKILSISLLTVMYGAVPARCQDAAAPESREQKASAISGAVRDAETTAPLSGANVLVVGTSLGAVTDSLGKFTLQGVQLGNQLLKISYTGYESALIPDVVVRSGRTSVILAGLRMKTIELESLTVEGSEFRETAEEPVSTVGFSNEEIRRAPGSAGDVSRIFSVLPSIAKVNDQVNGLVVRGGNPAENGFYIDNMEIPNINHYPQQGSSSGPIGLLNVDFLQDVNFSAGGFSAAYGDRLSSVMDIRFREGNRREFDSQLDMNMAGLGLVGEGPLAGGKGSWLFSARKSYLDLLVDAIGTGVAPQYSDYQGKAVIDLSSRQRLEFLGVAGIDHINFDKKTSLDDGKNFYGRADNVENMVGVNWSWRGESNWHSETSFSRMYTRYKDRFSATDDDSLGVDDRSSEASLTLRNVTYYRLAGGDGFKFGFEEKHIDNNYDSYFKDYRDQYGNLVPALTVNRPVNTDRLGAFFIYNWNPVPRLELNLGGRADHFTYNGNSHFSPRISFTVKLSEKTALNGSAGTYYQNLPLAILSQNRDFKELRDLESVHFILGISRLVSENTRLTVEAYDKEYRHFPLDPTKPGLFPADEGASHERLVDSGRAFTRGIEVVLQKKLAVDFYGLVSGSVYQSRYQGYDGIWRDRIYGNRYLFSLEGGRIFSQKWESSLRWVFAGGRPYTPFDLTATRALDTGIYDLSRINGKRHPAYHSLNFRVDRRFNFRDSNLVLYWDLWNVYNRKNIASYYWNEVENKVDRENQWSLLPVFGLEWEF